MTEACDLVRNFLSAMEARDLPRAAGFLSPDFQMTFPSGVMFTRLEQLIDWGAPRYRSVRKSYERFDVADDGAQTIVYCFGTLSGEWPDGKPFQGIRFIDRFTVRDGKLIDQRVWNDLSEVRGR